MNTLAFIALALKFNATIYGMNEYYCGDYDQKPTQCTQGLVTASGEIFDPGELTAAVPMPRNRVLKVSEIQLRAFDGQCLKIRITDKKHERYVGNGGIDLTPAAVKALTGKPANRFWSGKLVQC